MSAERRTGQILDAVEVLLRAGGVDAVTMRAVAAEAGVSLRLVQYYGHSKDELLTAALERLSARSVQDWQHDLEVTDDVRARLASFALTALPTDADSRALHRVGVSLELLAVTGHPAATAAYRSHLNRIEQHLVGACTSAGMASARATGLAHQTMALVHGIGSLVMTGQLTEAEARTAIDDFLDRHV